MPQQLKYSEEKIALLRTSIDNYIKSNPAYGYSVKIDGLLVVPRTRDLSLFDSMDQHVTDSTGNIVVMNYYGVQNKGEPMTFYLNDPIPTDEKQNLNGTKQSAPEQPAQNNREELRQQFFFEFQYETLTRENERLKLELEEARKVMREVEAFVRRVRDQSEQRGDKSMLKMIGDFITVMATKNPDLLKQYPMIETLAAVIPGDSEKHIAQPSPTNLGETPQVVIKPKEKQIDPETEKLIATLKSLRRHYSEIEFENWMQLIDWLKDCKDLLPHLRKWVVDSIKARTAYIKQMQQEQNATNHADESNEENENTFSDQSVNEANQKQDLTIMPQSDVFGLEPTPNY